MKKKSNYAPAFVIDLKKKLLTFIEGIHCVDHKCHQFNSKNMEIHSLSKSKHGSLVYVCSLKQQNIKSLSLQNIKTLSLQLNTIM